MDLGTKFTYTAFLGQCGTMPSIISRYPILFLRGYPNIAFTIESNVALAHPTAAELRSITIKIKSDVKKPKMLREFFALVEDEFNDVSVGNVSICQSNFIDTEVRLTL